MSWRKVLGVLYLLLGLLATAMVLQEVVFVLLRSDAVGDAAFCLLAMLTPLLPYGFILLFRSGKDPKD